MHQVKRQNGQQYADNVIDSLLDFEADQTWTVNGTGTALMDNALAYAGARSLRLENTAPTTDLVATNSVQSTALTLGGDYQLSCYLSKNDAGQAYSGSIEIFKNAVTYNTQTFTIGSDGSDEDNPDHNNRWVRYVSDETLTFNKSDVVTFKIQLDGITGYVGASTVLNIDGLMFNQNDRGNAMPPLYSRPVYNKTLQTSSVSIENLSLTSLGEYPDDAAAAVGGLISNQIYKTATGEIRIKL